MVYSFIIYYLILQQNPTEIEKQSENVWLYYFSLIIAKVNDTLGNSDLLSLKF